MATVVIAYGQRTQTALETGLLEGMGYTVRHLTASPFRSASSWPTPTRSW
jgi:hypothetical protein